MYFAQDWLGQENWPESELNTLWHFVKIELKQIILASSHPNHFILYIHAQYSWTQFYHLARWNPRPVQTFNVLSLTADSPFLITTLTTWQQMFLFFVFINISVQCSWRGYCFGSSYNMAIFCTSRKRLLNSDRKEPVTTYHLVCWRQNRTEIRHCSSNCWNLAIFSTSTLMSIPRIWRYIERGTNYSSC